MKDWELVFDHLTPPTNHLTPPTNDDATHCASSGQVTDDPHASRNMTSDPQCEEVGVSWSDLVLCLVQTLSPQAIGTLLAAHPLALLGGRGRMEEESKVHSLLLAAASLHTQQR